jgi:hypothetical protein
MRLPVERGADVAHHARLAELDEHRAFGVFGVISGDPDVA